MIRFCNYHSELRDPVEGCPGCLSVVEARERAAEIRAAIEEGRPWPATWPRRRLLRPEVEPPGFLAGLAPSSLSLGLRLLAPWAFGALLGLAALAGAC